jgi:hypothetical protein
MASGRQRNGLLSVHHHVRAEEAGATARACSESLGDRSPCEPDQSECRNGVERPARGGTRARARHRHGLRNHRATGSRLSDASECSLPRRYCEESRRSTDMSVGRDLAWGGIVKPTTLHRIPPRANATHTLVIAVDHLQRCAVRLRSWHRRVWRRIWRGWSFSQRHTEGTHGAAAINRLKPKLGDSKTGLVIEL